MDAGHREIRPVRKIMTLDALRSSTSTAQAAAGGSSESSSAFRQADFMAIMLAELSIRTRLSPLRRLNWWKMPRNCRNYPTPALNAIATISGPKT